MLKFYSIEYSIGCKPPIEYSIESKSPIEYSIESKIPIEYSIEHSINPIEYFRKGYFFLFSNLITFNNLI